MDFSSTDFKEVTDFLRWFIRFLLCISKHSESNSLKKCNPKRKEKMIVSFRVKKHDYESLKKEAEEMRISTSALIRMRIFKSKEQ